MYRIYWKGVIDVKSYVAVKYIYDRLGAKTHRIRPTEWHDAGGNLCF